MRFLRQIPSHFGRKSHFGVEPGIHAENGRKKAVSHFRVSPIFPETYSNLQQEDEGGEGDLLGEISTTTKSIQSLSTRQKLSSVPEDFFVRFTFFSLL